MRVRQEERGAALLTVLLLVAVMATIAATALDRIGVGTRLAVNVANVGQARAWLNMAELLATTRIEDLLVANESKTTLQGNWMGTERTIALPDGSTVRARVDDGGNCFNLNSIVQQRQDDGTTLARAPAARQFTALMTLLGIDPGEATRIAASATDYLDSDSVAIGSSGEDSARSDGGLSANRLMADASELRAVAGVSERAYQLLESWVCALPTADLSPINVNTLRTEQAPLVAMLVPGQADLSRARAAIASRPPSGWSDATDFWNEPPLASLAPDEVAQEQVKVKTSFFTLRARVTSGDLEFDEVALIDARQKPVRVVRRSWGSEG